MYSIISIYNTLSYLNHDNRNFKIVLMSSLFFCHVHDNIYQNKPANNTSTNYSDQKVAKYYIKVR